MSEYQYYEFLAIDRPLTEKEMREIRSWSTRARITSTSFVNHYEWGSFKGDEDEWMEKYFDAFLYLANWGTHILKLRLPSRLLDLKTAQLYCQVDARVSARTTARSSSISFPRTRKARSGPTVKGAFRRSSPYEPILPAAICGPCTWAGCSAYRTRNSTTKIRSRRCRRDLGRSTLPWKIWPSFSALTRICLLSPQR